MPAINANDLIPSSARAVAFELACSLGEGEEADEAVAAVYASHRASDRDVVAVAVGADILLVGDVNGPWAVRFRGDVA